VRERLEQLLVENDARPRRDRLKLTRVWDLLVREAFAAIYPFIGTVRDAIGFMIASNVYTTVAYVIHERAWSRVT
jgi:uncharacterized membrane protein